MPQYLRKMDHEKHFLYKFCFHLNIIKMFFPELTASIKIIRNSTIKSIFFRGYCGLQLQGFHQHIAGRSRGAELYSDRLIYRVF